MKKWVLQLPFFKKLNLFISQPNYNEIWDLTPFFRSQLQSGLFKPSWKCCKVQQRDDNSFDTDGWRLFSSRRSTTTVQHSSLLVYNSPKVLKNKSAKSFFPHSLPFREEIRSNCFKLKVDIFWEGKYTTSHSLKCEKSLEAIFRDLLID